MRLWFNWGIYQPVSFKGNFKELPEKPFSARFQLFFHRILKFFWLVVSRIRNHFSFPIGVGEQVFILNYVIWSIIHEICSKPHIMLDLDYHLCVALQFMKLYVKAVMRISMMCGFGVISGNIAQNLIYHNENLFSIMLEHFQNASRHGFTLQKNFQNSTKKKLETR